MLKGAENKGFIDRNKRLYLALAHCQPLEVYGLPKIHKDNRPFRPIVSSTKSPTYNLTKELAKILTPLCGKTSHHVCDLTHFVRFLDGVQLGTLE